MYHKKKIPAPFQNIPSDITPCSMDTPVAAREKPASPSLPKRTAFSPLTALLLYKGFFDAKKERDG